MKNLFLIAILGVLFQGCTKDSELSYNDPVSEVATEIFGNPDKSLTLDPLEVQEKRGVYFASNGGYNVEMRFEEVSHEQKVMHYRLTNKDGVIQTGQMEFNLRQGETGDHIMVDLSDLVQGISCEEYPDICAYHECVANLAPTMVYAVAAAGWWCPECVAAYAAAIVVHCAIEIALTPA